MHLRGLIIIAFCFQFFEMYAQSVSKADALMSDYKYSEAIVELKPLVDKGNIQAIRKIAECYRKINDYVNAEKYYSIVVVDKNSIPKNYLYYGQMLMNNNKYEEAQQWFNTFLSSKPNIKDSTLATTLLTSCFKNLGEITPNRKVKLYNLEILNSVAADFSAVAYGDKIIFTSSRQGKKNSFDGQSFAQVYIASIKTDSQYIVTPLTGTINSKNFNSGPASINAQKSKIYYTKNNIQYGDAISNKKDVVTLKIFEAKFDGINAKDFSEMAFNDAEYSCAYPAINKEGDLIYYTSDRAGGFGGKDIYYSTLKDGKWTKPKNAGNVINTPGDEKFPFVHDDGTLYFSSNGHQGLGGLDIYRVITNDSGRVTNIINLGLPFNSSSDDFGYFLDSNYHKGFISSDRIKGKGSDDIYAFEYEAIPFVLQVFSDTISIDSAMICLNNKSKRDTFYTNNLGYVNIELLPNSFYKINIEKDSFIAKELNIKTSDIYKPITKKINLKIKDESIKIDVPIEQEINTIAKEPIQIIEEVKPDEQ